MAATLASPAYRRWQRTLKSLDLDPDRLDRPVAGPEPGDFFICGSPRSGTALLSAMLFQPPQVVTVMEPWDAMRMRPDALFASLRKELATGTLGRGRLDLGALREHGAVSWCRDGEKPVAVETDANTVLGVKFPAFWRYLELMPESKFLVCLRDPAEVVSSYRAVGGRLREGFDYAIPFNARMNAELQSATSDAAIRRILLYDYIHERILPHLNRPNVLSVRYERWFSERQDVLAEIGDFLGVDVSHPLPELRRPTARPPGGEDVRLLQEYCSTARPLGYTWETAT